MITRKLCIYFIFLASIVKAEWLTVDSYRLQNIESDTHAILTTSTESHGNLIDIKGNLYDIKKQWKPILDNIATYNSGIKDNTTQIYNILQSLSSIYPTISDTSWFGQLLQNTISLKTKIDSMSSDLSDIKYKVENIDTNVADIKNDVVTIKDDVSSIDSNVGSIQGNLSTIDTNLYSIKNNTTEIKNDTSIIADYQSQILSAIQKGDTNLYKAFFTPTAPANNFYAVNNSNYQRYNIGLDNSIIDPLYYGNISETPSKSQSFSESLFLYINKLLTGSSYSIKLLSSGILNLQDIRNVGINTITNQLAEIISKSNTVAKIQVDKINLDYTPIRQYGADINVHNAFTTENLNTTGDFYQDLIKFSKAQVELQSGNNLGLLSIITNLQAIVSNLTKEPDIDDLEESADETGQQITGELEDNQDNDGTKYIGFKNEYQNIKNSLSFGSLEDNVNSYSKSLTIMERYYFEIGDLSIEIPAIEVSLESLDQITNFVRFVMTICWVGILLALIFMFYRFFLFFASKFVEFTSKMTGQ